MTRRLAWAALLAVCWTGCIDRDNELIIDNGGHQPVLVDIRREYHPLSLRRDEHEVAEVVGFSAFVGKYASFERMRLLVSRKSDGAILYAGSLSESDFDDWNGHIRFTVYP